MKANPDIAKTSLKNVAVSEDTTTLPDKEKSQLLSHNHSQQEPIIPHEGQPHRVRHPANIARPACASEALRSKRKSSCPPHASSTGAGQADAARKVVLQPKGYCGCPCSAATTGAAETATEQIPTRGSTIAYHAQCRMREGRTKT